jgi:putative membrane protein
MDLSHDDRQRISAAIAAAEARTSGEIVCVLARSSAEATPLAVTVSALAALAVPWLLVSLTRLPVLQILGLQIVVFLVLTALLCLPAVRVRLLPAATRRAMAHRAAHEQFMLRGIGRTRGRTGVLIFVSLAERYARVVADQAIAAQVGQGEWQAAVDALVAHLRDGRIADGFVAAIGCCGDLLAAHFPPPAGAHGELPDRIYVI